MTEVYQIEKGEERMGDVRQDDRKLMGDLEKEIIMGVGDVTVSKAVLIEISCDCGNTLNIDEGCKWEINMCGIWQFRCKKCKRVFTIPGGRIVYSMWKTDS